MKLKPSKEDVEAVKPKFQTPYNRHLFIEAYEVNELPSMTKPDESFSMRELLDRYVKGLPISGKVYNPDDDFPDLRKLDLVQIQELIEENRAHISEMEKKIHQANLEVKERQEFERLRAKFDQEKEAAAGDKKEGGEDEKQ